MNGARDGLRLSALLLHAMVAQDRDWLMRRLDPEQGLALQALLDELRRLGIPSDRGVLDQALRTVASERCGAGEAGNELALADPAQLAELLRREPGRLVARLLAQRDWPWQEALLALLPAASRLCGADGPRHSELVAAPKLDAALLAALGRRLQAGPRLPLAPPPRKRWWRRPAREQAHHE